MLIYPDWVDEAFWIGLGKVAVAEIEGIALFLLEEWKGAGVDADVRRSYSR